MLVWALIEGGGERTENVGIFDEMACNWVRMQQYGEISCKLL